MENKTLPWQKEGIQLLECNLTYDYTRSENMKVRELIKELQDMPQDQEVVFKDFFMVPEKFIEIVMEHRGVVVLSSSDELTEMRSKKSSD